MRLYVEKLVKKHGTSNPITIAKNLGIQIIYEPLGSINGYYNMMYRIKFIHINEQLEEAVVRFVVAHELGHALLHPKTNTLFMRKCTLFDVSKFEQEANQFATELITYDLEHTENLDTEHLKKSLQQYIETLRHIGV